MVAQVHQGTKIVVHQRQRHEVRSDIPMEPSDVLLMLFLQCRSGFANLLAMMQRLHRLLQTDCDEQAYGDGAEMDEEIPPGVDALMRRVDVEHVGRTLCDGGWSRLCECCCLRG